MSLPPAPVRIVHLGLGAFSRSHQAWWTGRVDSGNDWGIAAFGGRSPRLAEALRQQNGLFTLIERGPVSDVPSLVGSIVEAIDGDDADRLAQLVGGESTSIVTITVTEAGYRLNPDGSPDETDLDMAADLNDGTARTPLGRLVAALERRRRIDAPLAVVSCDNVTANGEFVRHGVLAIAERRDDRLASWIAEKVSFVSTSVDRITPRLSDADRDITRSLAGWVDVAPVVAEPFHDWVLSGDFPAGRPRWELEGARFVDDIAPFERRKLWLLNGAHSLLAYLGQLRGHLVVAEAVNDQVCRGAVLNFWAEARMALPSDESLNLDDYCAALLDRFENPRIRHELAQIGVDGATKLRMRVVPTARNERHAGRDARGCALVVAAWVAAIRAGLYGADSESVAIRDADGDPRALIALLDLDLGSDSGFAAAVLFELEAMQRKQS